MYRMELTASDYKFSCAIMAILEERSWSTIMDKLRRNGAAYKNAVQIRDEYKDEIFRRWNNKRVPHGGIFNDIANLLSQKYINAVNALSRNEFTINYNIYGHTTAERMTDILENTVEFKMHMRWRKMFIVVRTVAGVCTPMNYKPEIMKMITTGVLERGEFARKSNMEPESIKNMKQYKSHILLNVLKSALGGQNLLTRLVKGVLLVLDLEQSGPQKVIGDIQSLPFTLEGLLSIHEANNPAFVFSSVPLSSKHNFMLYQMCMSYPSEAIKTSNPHIKIPADGNVYLVLDLSLDRKMEAEMTAKEAWASLIIYATHMDVLPELEKAMVIASSLSQNRYVLNASLPNVVSGANLVRPLMMLPNSSATQPTMINLNMAKLVGRIHQLSILTKLKHLIIAAKKIRKDNWRDIVPGLLSNYRNTITDAGPQDSSFDKLIKTLDSYWSTKLTTRGINHIAKFSIFEGLWIHDNCSEGFLGKSPSYYGYHAVHYNYESRHDILVEELRKAGIEKLPNLPKKSFSIDSPCISIENVEEEEDDFETMNDIEDFYFGAKEED